MTATTAVANQKGGVGKTATTLNMGAALAELGRSVALIDLDPQGHLTRALGQQHVDSEANLANALTGEWAGDVAELFVDYSAPAGNGQGELEMWLLPTTPQMFVVGRSLDQMRAREHRLAR
ncbi:MAG: ParA family protein, partial [Pseudonocardiaceae bacterium]